jgi:hypothetical protein
MAPSDSVNVQLQRATRTHDLILELHPRGTFRGTIRNRFFHVLCDLTIEHLGAIIHLVRTEQHYGSAFALLRPLIESCLRGFWLLYVAADERVMLIAKRQKDFPAFKDVRSLVEKHFEERGGVPGLFVMKQEFVNALHGLTHSGVEQLINRFDENLEIRPHYSDTDLVNMLDQASRFTVMAGIARIQHVEGSEHILSPNTEALVVRFNRIASE